MNRCAAVRGWSRYRSIALPDGYRYVPACCAESSLTPRASAMIQFGRLLSCPRHESCCRCATACTTLRSSSCFRFLSSPFEAKGREETSMVGGIWSRNACCDGAGRGNRLIRDCCPWPGQRVPCSPRPEGEQGKRTRTREESGTQAVSAAAATGMTRAAWEQLGFSVWRPSGS
jgi:hypothetical protein